MDSPSSNDVPPVLVVTLRVYPIIMSTDVFDDWVRLRISLTLLLCLTLLLFLLLLLVVRWLLQVTPPLRVLKNRLRYPHLLLVLSRLLCHLFLSLGFPLKRSSLTQIRISPMERIMWSCPSFFIESIDCIHLSVILYLPYIHLRTSLLHRL